MKNEYQCSKCNKSIDDEINSLIIDKVSKSENTEEYFALCPECLKNIEAEVSE